jgi:UDP-N-acetyl-D-galactosamine dehydrogenase
VSPAHTRCISVIGLGYVGLPVATAFANAGNLVVAFDIDAGRVEELRGGRDRTGEVACEELIAARLALTTDPEDLRRADFHIVTVPTPVTATKLPDLSALLAATRTIGRVLKKGDIVVYESTVYPGATEDECVPVLEAESGLRVVDDFGVGYSPERINPGDPEHRFEIITKVVAGSDVRTLAVAVAVYGSVVRAGIHEAPSIRVAEAAKVIENTQRDLNIALMNELAMVCDRLNIPTRDVLAAARTKWNFLRFSPGLVGGHCVGVDPYYLTAWERMSRKN